MKNVIKQCDNTTISTAYAAAGYGWWQYDLKTGIIACSPLIVEQLGLDSPHIPLSDLLRMISCHSPERMTKSTGKASIGHTEETYLINTPIGPRWIRIRPISRGAHSEIICGLSKLVHEESLVKPADRSYRNLCRLTDQLRTKLQHGQQEEQDELQRKSQLCSHLPIGFITLRLHYDDKGTPINYTIEKLNERATHLLGVDETIIGEPCETFLPPHILDGSAARLAKTYDAGIPATHTITLHTTGRCCKFNLIPSPNHRLLCFITDITKLRQTKEKLARRNEMMNKVIERLPLGLEIYNNEGVMIKTNQHNRQTFGITNSEDLSSINIFNDPAFTQETLQQLTSHGRTSFRIGYEELQAHPKTRQLSSKDISLYVVASIIRDKEGNPANYIIVNLEETDIKRAYGRLAELDKTFAAISSFGEIGHAYFDLNTFEGTAQPQWFENLGHTPQSDLKAVLTDLPHLADEDRAMLQQQIDDMRQGTTDHFTAELRLSHNTPPSATGDTPPSQPHWINLTMMRDSEESNPPTAERQVISISYNISDLKASEGKLAIAKEQAEESNRLKSAFLGNMSHEIRTPLNAIIGFSELLVETESTEERQSYTEVVEENREQLLQLINDILDLSKIEAGTLEFNDEEFDVRELCREAMYTTDYSYDSPVQIIFDEQPETIKLHNAASRIKQIMDNFVSNALKFTHTGSITIGYDLSDDTHVRLYVKDTGCGIPHEKIDKIFDRFIKLNEFAQGTGLGLSICRSIAERIGGSIRVDSTPGKGTTMSLIIPRT